jgi:hypothetical protein
MIDIDVDILLYGITRVDVGVDRDLAPVQIV